ASPHHATGKVDRGLESLGGIEVAPGHNRAHDGEGIDFVIGSDGHTEVRVPRSAARPHIHADYCATRAPPAHVAPGEPRIASTRIHCPEDHEVGLPANPSERRGCPATALGGEYRGRRRGGEAV